MMRKAVQLIIVSVLQTPDVLDEERRVNMRGLSPVHQTHKTNGRRIDKKRRGTSSLEPEVRTLSQLRSREERKEVWREEEGREGEEREERSL